MQPRKQSVDPVKLFRGLGAGSRESTHQQILFDRQRRKQRAAFRDLKQAALDDGTWRLARDGTAFEMDRSVGDLTVFLAKDTGDRLEDGGFPGAVRTQ